MNGTSLTLKDEIKKNIDSKKREKFKFLSAIFISNIFVFYIMYTPKNIEIKNHQSNKILHKNYQIVTLPIQSLVSTEEINRTETPVTILSNDKKIIIQKAYLHQAAGKDEEKTYFKIEISNQDLITLGDFLQESMIAIPYVEKTHSISFKKRGSKYEVNF